MPQDSSRWELLFADLEAQLAAEEAAERAGAVAELTRAEQAQVTFADRLRDARGRLVRLVLRDGSRVEGRVVRVAVQWCQLDARGARGRAQHVVPFSAISSAEGVGHHAAGSAARTDSLGLGSALRALQQDRARVRVSTVGEDVLGVIARVGADHLDLEEVDRAQPVRRLVPFAALLCVSEA